MATTSQPRSLLSIAKLNIARSRVRPSIWSFVRINQTCLGRSGGFAPVSFPLFHGTRWAAFYLIMHGHTPRLGYRVDKHEPQVFASKSGQVRSGLGRRRTSPLARRKIPKDHLLRKIEAVV